MKLLISAYACEPDRGSEHGVGWHWIKTLAQSEHDVWVITRKNSQHLIEQAQYQEILGSNIRFIYYDLPRWLCFWKKGTQGLHLYYLLWQIGIFFAARQLTQKIDIDQIHHITFVSIHQPSFLGCLGIPFIFGPVAGGDFIPWRLRKSIPCRGRLWEFGRDVMNALVRFDPLMQLTLFTARKIYVTSPETQKLIPKRYQVKTLIQLAIGLEGLPPTLPSLDLPPTLSSFNILYAGNLLYLKGLHLGLRAFARLYQEYSGINLTLIGNGIDENWLRSLCRQLQIEPGVKWLPYLQQSVLMNYYPQHDVFLFPSLRDSGGMVILEAMAFGLPVVCLDRGGPGIMVDPSCGIAVSTESASEADIVQGLYEALKILYLQPEVRHTLSQGASKRVQAFTWRQLVNAVIRKSGEQAGE